MKRNYTKGMFITGAAQPGQLVPSKRDMIQKGTFLISDGGPVLLTKSSAPAPRYGESTPSLDEIRKRLDALGVKIKQVAQVQTSALELRWQLRQLQHKYQLAPEPHVVPPIEPTSYAMILEGAAATCDQDLDRMQLVPYAFGHPLPRSVPLLLKHNPDIVVGTVQQLHYDRNGNLRVRARVEHPQARCLNAFSVGLRIIECELRDADSERFHGVLKRVELTEISLTDTPSNPRARVEQRIPAVISDHYSALQDGVRCIAKYLQLAAQLHARA